MTPSNQNDSFQKTRRIILAHGGGGQLTDELLDEVVRPRLSNATLDALDDSAMLEVPAGKIAFTTDSYVVRPLEFPGGDIGRLAVSGTVNDLAVCGAKPLGISLGLILEEGLEIARLERILDSIAKTAEEACVSVVTGDTKVVARGQADGVYINTSGVGVINTANPPSVQNVQPGDVVIVNGTIADHGLAVMLQREEGASITSELRSDVAPLNGLIQNILAQTYAVVFMRDATRGGLAGVLADLSDESGYHLTIDETQIPIRPETLYAADLLGLEPLEVANEGKVVIVARPDAAELVLQTMREHPLGRQASLIGRFEEERDGICELVTDVGGRRVLQKPYGEQLPRIC
jgi:hydrogenase expression/formation protein HypE